MEKLTNSLGLLKAEIERVTDENLNVKMEFDNEKILLNMRLKSESEINLKL
jgi:hypothetical protein